MLWVDGGAVWMVRVSWCVCLSFFVECQSEGSHYYYFWVVGEEAKSRNLYNRRSVYLVFYQCCSMLVNSVGAAKSLCSHNDRTLTVDDGDRVSALQHSIQHSLGLQNHTPGSVELSKLSTVRAFQLPNTRKLHSHVDALLKLKAIRPELNICCLSFKITT